MEKYQDFSVNIQASQWDSFVAEFREVINCNYWKRRDDFIKRSQDVSTYEDKEIMCIETPQIDFNGHILHAVMWLWMHTSSSSIEVFNIIPLIGNHLECSEYNYILEHFRQSIIVPMSHNFTLRVVVSKPYLDVEDIIGGESFGYLNRFSSGANKSTGHTHPCDFNRWCEFIFSIYRNHKHFSANDLMNWLIEDGWTEDMANELSLDYEYTLDVLDKYEQDRH